VEQQRELLEQADARKLALLKRWGGFRLAA